MKEDPDLFTVETFQRAKEACLPAHMPDFLRPGGAKRQFTLLSQPWMTAEALGYQKIGRDNRSVFKETIEYYTADDERVGTSKPRPDTPPWMIDQDYMMELEAAEAEDAEDLQQLDQDPAPDEALFVG